MFKDNHMVVYQILFIAYFIVFIFFKYYTRRNQSRMIYPMPQKTDKNSDTVIIILITAAFLLSIFYVRSIYRKEITEQRPKTTIQESNTVNNDDSYRSAATQGNTHPEALSYGVTTVEINYPVPFGGKTKQEIYDIRKKYVKESIFSDIPNYYPSEEVFGQIVDFKPWYSIYNSCRQPDGKASVDGPSEEARFIINPSVLVGIEPTKTLPYKKDSSWCSDKFKHYLLMSTHPNSAFYEYSDKTLTVKYKALPINKWEYILNGLNARDLGYKYVYLDKSKSVLHDIYFSSPDNLSESVKEFYSFIHVGNSCKHEGGCNNGSPYQPELSFNLNAISEQKQNYKLYLKLWKERPASPYDKADFTEIMTFGSR